MASSPRIDELRKKFEENPRRYFAPLANEYRKAGDVQQAIAICREYLPQQPGHMSGHIVFGQALYEARTFDEAKAVFETALSLDPENLIALRHLGDIALITGDTENARTWYKRVLEADPRNEEIQAQLATIDTAMSSAPTPAITPAVTPPPAPSPSAPTVVMKAVQPPTRPAASAPVTATSPTAEIDLETITPASVPAANPPAEPTVEIPVTTTAMAGAADAGSEPVASLEGLEGTNAGAADAPISSFSLDGLETTSLSTSEAPPPPPLADLDFGPAGAPPPPPAPSVDLDFGTPDVPAPAPAAESLPDLDFGPPPAAATAPAPAPVEVPTIDLATEAEPPALDLELGSLSAPPPPAAPPVPAPPMEVASAADEAPLDLELSIPSTPAPVAEIPVAEIPPAASPVAEQPMDLPAATAPAPVEPSSPFMTETMAELYVQQGHREEALRVYRALLEQRPGDAGLESRIAALEAESAPPPVVPASGPSIRELLIAIATRRPGYRPDWPGSNGSAYAAEQVVAPAAEQPARSASATPEVPHPAEARGDALAAALSFAAVSAQDEGAAHVLARAFSRNGHVPGEPLPAGAPARPAADELTLQTVFKSGESAPPPSSFSFDQFFSQRAAADAAGGATEGQAAESAEEVAQFTQWLEGLKKR